MIRVALVAAAVLASTSAFAGEVYNFRIGGQSFHIEQPRNCNDTSCMVVSIPGIYEQNIKRKKPRDTDEQQAKASGEKKDADSRPAPIDAAPPAPAPQPSQHSVASVTPEKPPEAGKITAQLPEKPAAPPDAQRAEPQKETHVPAEQKVAALPPAPAPNSQPVVTPVANSPLGVWLTEDKDRKVRIEECGANLCGYLVNAKTNANGEKVLLNMRPGKERWSGKIHDPRDGSNYDSTLAMRGDGKLRVQGCAFGGMFCGGQTWTRVN